MFYIVQNVHLCGFLQKLNYFKAIAYFNLDEDEQIHLAFTDISHKKFIKKF